ncbi:27742_t:CDS:2 [Gigaspora margarita]|uniref:27742_t:CDS:1 n=1 Tax=Gigaspora margarita TaxID=4874 RepID=A0ABN7V8M1_GIGMA|nr:27742_t:CDS:2 [Gigaspora margarita]
MYCVSPNIRCVNIYDFCVGARLTIPSKWANEYKMYGHHITNETSASSFIPDEASTSNNNIPNETFYEASASNSYITNDKSNDVSISNNIANETSLDVSTTNNHFFLSEPFNKISTSNNRIPNETINQYIINETSTQHILNKTSNQHTPNETSNQHIHSETSDFKSSYS